MEISRPFATLALRPLRKCSLWTVLKTGKPLWKANTSASQIKQSLDIKILVIDDEERSAAPWRGEDARLVSLFERFFFNKIFIVRHGYIANGLINTILIQNYSTVQYTVNIHGLLQCSVDEEIFVCFGVLPIRDQTQTHRQHGQHRGAISLCPGGSRWRMQGTGKEVSWCSKQYTNTECT